MNQRIGKHRFGVDNGIVGNEKRTEVEVIVSGLIPNEKPAIGLTLVQKQNLGVDYGPVSVQPHNERAAVDVGVYDEAGEWQYRGPSVTISSGLASLGYASGDKISLVRHMDASGRLRYLCETQKDNPFGRTNNPLMEPAEAIVAALYDDSINLLGLNDNQMKNLGLDSYGAVIIGSKGYSLHASVQSEKEMISSFGAGIAVSKDIAEVLELNLESRVLLHRI